MHLFDASGEFCFFFLQPNNNNALKVRAIVNNLIILQKKESRVFATNSDFLIPISLPTTVVDLSYFKL